MPSRSRGLRLEIRPGRHAAIGALDELAGGDGIAGGIEHVCAQEDLVRGMRGVGLVLVDEGGRRVDRAIDVVRLVDRSRVVVQMPSAPEPGRARQHHEVGRGCPAT